MPPDRATVAVLGAGNMGTALSQVIASNGHAVRLWSIETDVLEEIRDHRRNTKYLEGIDLHASISAVWELAGAVRDSDLIIVSVPSQVVGDLAAGIAPLLAPGQVILNVAKGLEGGTHRRMSECLVAAFGAGYVATTGSMGGPAIAIEMARSLPMAVIIGISDSAACDRAQAIIQNEDLKVETTSDVIGLEMCATLKNVYAIALGMCDGLGLGTNTKAFLASLALKEMSSITVALGGRPETVYGLAGLGDLLTTGLSEYSRNRTLGEKLGADADWKRFLETNTVEGVIACRAVGELTTGGRVSTPLFAMVHEVLFEEHHGPGAIARFLREFSY